MQLKQAPIEDILTQIRTKISFTFTQDSEERNCAVVLLLLKANPASLIFDIRMLFLMSNIKVVNPMNIANGRKKTAVHAVRQKTDSHRTWDQYTELQFVNVSKGNTAKDRQHPT